MLKGEVYEEDQKRERDTVKYLGVYRSIILLKRILSRMERFGMDSCDSA
jgi:hypothetical protein